MYDFSDAPIQDHGGLIPNGTIARLRLDIKYPSEPGDCPELTRSTSSQAQYLDCEITITSSPMEDRKLWQKISIVNVSDKALGINRAILRAILEGARSIQPDDMSDNAIRGRQVSSLSEFNGIQFAAKIGVEKGVNGYKDKNKISMVITPDKPEYQSAMSGNTTVGQQSTRDRDTGRQQQPAQQQWAQATQPAQQQRAQATQPAQQQMWGAQAGDANNGGQVGQQQPAQQASNPVPSWAQ
jgi:hypothetical protein